MSEVRGQDKGMRAEPGGTTVPAPQPEDKDVLVHIVDDDAAIRDSLAWLFYSRGIATQTWSSGESFLEAWSVALEGCILLDIRMQNMSGLEMFDHLQARGALQPVVFLTGHGDLPMAVDALKRGAVDFIEKPFNDNDLVDRVLDAIRHGRRQREQRLRTLDRDQKVATLSMREREVLEKILAGLLNKQVADELGVSMRTVEVHRARILEKMGARNVVELARLFGADDWQDREAGA